MESVANIALKNTNLENCKTILLFKQYNCKSAYSSVIKSVAFNE